MIPTTTFSSDLSTPHSNLIDKKNKNTTDKDKTTKTYILTFTN